MKKSLIAALCVGVAFALAGAVESEAAKKKLRGKDLTPQQRKEFMVSARKACRKKFGAPAHVARVDWYSLKIWCWAN